MGQLLFFFLGVIAEHVDSFAKNLKMGLEKIMKVWINNYRKFLNLGGGGNNYWGQGGGRVTLRILPWKSLSKIQH